MKYQLFQENTVKNEDKSTKGKRKIVPVSALAQFLVMGEKSLDK